MRRLLAALIVATFVYVCLGLDSAYAQDVVVLEHVKLHADMKTAVYWFKVNKELRVLTYHVATKNIKIEVRDQPEGKLFVQLLVTQDGIMARTADGEFKLQKGKRVLPANTDKRSVWLLGQNFIHNTTTAPEVLLDKAAKQLPSDKTLAVDTKASETSARGIGFPVNINIPVLEDIWEWMTEEEDCLSPNKKLTCTETGTDGKTTEVEKICDCGIPQCTTQTFTVDVPVLVKDVSGATQVEQTPVTVVTCVCWCLMLGGLSPG